MCYTYRGSSLLDRLTHYPSPYGEECTGIDETKEDTEEHEATVDDDPIKRFPWRIEVFRMIYDRSLGLVDGGLRGLRFGWPWRAILPYQKHNRLSRFVQHCVLHRLTLPRCDACSKESQMLVEPGCPGSSE